MGCACFFAPRLLFPSAAIYGMIPPSFDKGGANLRDVQALDAYITELYTKKKLPGISVAAIGPDGEAFAKGYGRASADGERMCDPDTVFGIASMSKSQTALALAMLECEGKISFDDPVYMHFPGFHIPGTAKDAVTLRHLAMHTAGIPPIPPLEWSIAMHAEVRQNDWVKKLRQTAPNPFDTIDQIIEYIATCGYPPLGAPGEYMSYCNEGYALLSYAVDQAAGMPLERFLRERVYAPLGMMRTVLDVDASEARALSGGNITSLFEEEDGKIVADDEWSVLPPYRGCGLVKSTARDMAVYYRCLAMGGLHEGKQIIPKQAILRIAGPAFPLRRETTYCLGLYKREWMGREILEHSGGLHGVSSHGGCIMPEGFGFAALCNLGDQEVDSFVWAMYNWVLGDELSRKHRWYAPVGRSFSDPEMIEGTYRTHEGLPVDVVVYQKGGELFAEREDKRMPLSYCGGTLFAAFDAEDAVTLRLEAFIRDGKAWGVRCGSRIYRRV